MNLEQRARLGEGWLAYLDGKQPEYSLTLTFRYPYGDRVAGDALKCFVQKLLKRLPRRARESFGGLVCAERHIDVKFDGSYHFHFLIWGMDEQMADARDWLDINVPRAASQLYPRSPSYLCDCREAKKERRRKTCKGGMSCRGPQMSGRRQVNVQTIDRTPEKIHEYTVSDIYRLDRPAGAQILDIGFHGVTANLLTEELL